MRIWTVAVRWFGQYLSNFDRHFSFQSYSLGFSLVPDAIVGPQAPQGFIYIGDQDLTKIHKIEHQQVPTNDLFVC